MQNIKLLIIFLLVSIYIIPAAAQSFDPDAVIKSSQVREDVQHKHTTNDIFEHILSGDTSSDYYTLMLIQLLDDEAIDYILPKLPSAVDPDTGSINQGIIVTLVAAGEKGKERLSEDILTALSISKGRDLFNLLSNVDLSKGNQDLIAPQLFDIMFDNTALLEVRKEARDALKKMDPKIVQSIPVQTDWLLPFMQQVEIESYGILYFVSDLSRMFPEIAVEIHRLTPILYQSSNRKVKEFALDLIVFTDADTGLESSLKQLLLEAMKDPVVYAKAIDLSLRQDETQHEAIDYLLSVIMDGVPLGGTQDAQIDNEQVFNYWKNVDVEGEYALERLNSYYETGDDYQKIYAVWFMGLMRYNRDRAAEELSRIIELQNETVVQTAKDALASLKNGGCWVETSSFKKLDGHYSFMCFIESMARATPAHIPRPNKEKSSLVVPERVSEPSKETVETPQQPEVKPKPVPTQVSADPGESADEVSISFVAPSSHSKPLPFPETSFSDPRPIIMLDPIVYGDPAKHSDKTMIQNHGDHLLKVRISGTVYDFIADIVPDEKADIKFVEIKGYDHGVSQKAEVLAVPFFQQDALPPNKYSDELKAMPDEHRFQMNLYQPFRFVGRFESEILTLSPRNGSNDLVVEAVNANGKSGFSLVEINVDYNRDEEKFEYDIELDNQMDPGLINPVLVYINDPSLNEDNVKDAIATLNGVRVGVKIVNGQPQLDRPIMGISGVPPKGILNLVQVTGAANSFVIQYKGLVKIFHWSYTR